MGTPSHISLTACKNVKLRNSCESIFSPVLSGKVEFSLLLSVVKVKTFFMTHTWRSSYSKFSNYSHCNVCITSADLNGLTVANQFLHSVHLISHSLLKWHNMNMYIYRGLLKRQFSTWLFVTFTLNSLSSVNPCEPCHVNYSISIRDYSCLHIVHKYSFKVPSIADSPSSSYIKESM